MHGHWALWARTEVGAVHDLHEALLGLALAQAQAHGGGVRDDVAAHRLLGVRHKHGAARRVAHYLRAEVGWGHVTRLRYNVMAAHRLQGLGYTS